MDKRVIADPDLIAFTEARLAEEEAAARDVSPEDWGDTSAWAEFGTPVAVHFHYQDPRVVLDDIAAKRAVLTWYASAIETAEMFREKLGSGDHMEVAAESYLNVIKAHAAKWRDHPDYREAWKPPTFQP